MQKLATQNVVWDSLSQFRGPSRAWGQLAILAACLGLGPASSALAQQTLYWSGTSGTNAPLWSTLGAWSTLSGSWSQPAAIPDATNNVVFSISSLTTPQDVYLGGTQSALGLTFSSTSATVFRGGALGSPAVNTLALYDELFRKEDVNRLLLAFQNDQLSHLAHPQVAEGPVLAFGLTVGGVYQELDMPLDGEAGRPTFAELTDGKPHHIAATYSAKSGEKALYIDGDKKFFVLYPAESKMTSGGAQPLFIGSSIGGENFSGLLDEVAI